MAQKPSNDHGAQFRKEQAEFQSKLQTRTPTPPRGKDGKFQPVKRGKK